jgi:hypothetical protein
VVLVFNSDWVDSIKQRYERLPSYQRPVLYSVAVDKKKENLRQEIEDWVKDLPQAARNKVIPRLRSPNNLQQAYNELAVGHTMKQLGYELEYEKQIAGITPDWYITKKGKVPPFVVEVFTANPPEDRIAELKKWDYLYGRLKEIPVGVVLGIRTHPTNAAPDQRRSKAITSALERWLISEKPRVGEHLSTNGITFEVLSRSAKYQHVLCFGGGGPANTFWVDTSSLRENLRQKVKKYSVLGKQGIPLVVGIVADFYTGLSRDNLEDVLLGNEAFEISFEEHTGTVVGQELVRRNDGSLTRIDSVLSAVVWVSKEAGVWEANAIFNPRAANPLPDNTFGSHSPSHS